MYNFLEEIIEQFKVCFLFEAFHCSSYLQPAALMYQLELSTGNNYNLVIIHFTAIVHLEGN